MKTFQKRNEGFTCVHCQKAVAPVLRSSRNHCPHCLYSMHVDLKTPGDRMSECHGIMKPTGVAFNGKKQLYQIEFTCETCGHTHMNKTAPDDDAGLIGELMREANVRNIVK